VCGLGKVVKLTGGCVDGNKTAEIMPTWCRQTKANLASKDLPKIESYQNAQIGYMKVIVPSLDRFENGAYIYKLEDGEFATASPAYYAMLFAVAASNTTCPNITKVEYRYKSFDSHLLEQYQLKKERCVRFEPSCHMVANRYRCNSSIGTKIYDMKIIHSKECYNIWDGAYTDTLFYKEGDKWRSRQKEDVCDSWCYMRETVGAYTTILIIFISSAAAIIGVSSYIYFTFFIIGLAKKGAACILDGQYVAVSDCGDQPAVSIINTLFQLGSEDFTIHVPQYWSFNAFSCLNQTFCEVQDDDHILVNAYAYDDFGNDGRSVIRQSSFPHLNPDCIYTFINIMTNVRYNMSVCHIPVAEKIMTESFEIPESLANIFFTIFIAMCAALIICLCLVIIYKMNHMQRLIVSALMAQGLVPIVRGISVQDVLISDVSTTVLYSDLMTGKVTALFGSCVVQPSEGYPYAETGSLTFVPGKGCGMIERILVTHQSGTDVAYIDSYHSNKPRYSEVPTWLPLKANAIVSYLSTVGVLYKILDYGVILSLMIIALQFWPVPVQAYEVLESSLTRCTSIMICILMGAISKKAFFLSLLFCTAFDIATAKVIHVDKESGLECIPHSPTSCKVKYSTELVTLSADDCEVFNLARSETETGLSIKLCIKKFQKATYQAWNSYYCSVPKIDINHDDRCPGGRSLHRVIQHCQTAPSHIFAKAECRAVCGCAGCGCFSCADGESCCSIRYEFDDSCYVPIHIFREAHVETELEVVVGVDETNDGKPKLEYCTIDGELIGNYHTSGYFLSPTIKAQMVTALNSEGEKSTYSVSECEPCIYEGMIVNNKEKIDGCITECLTDGASSWCYTNDTKYMERDDQWIAENMHNVERVAEGHFHCTMNCIMKQTGSARIKCDENIAIYSGTSSFFTEDFEGDAVGIIIPSGVNCSISFKQLTKGIKNCNLEKCNNFESKSLRVKRSFKKSGQMHIKGTFGSMDITLDVEGSTHYIFPRYYASIMKDGKLDSHKKFDGARPAEAICSGSHTFGSSLPGGIRLPRWDHTCVRANQDRNRCSWSQPQNMEFQEWRSQEDVPLEWEVEQNNIMISGGTIFARPCAAYASRRYHSQSIRRATIISHVTRPVNGHLKRFFLSGDFILSYSAPTTKVHSMICRSCILLSTLSKTHCSINLIVSGSSGSVTLTVNDVDRSIAVRPGWSEVFVDIEYSPHVTLRIDDQICSLKTSVISVHKLPSGLLGSVYNTTVWKSGYSFGGIDFSFLSDFGSAIEIIIFIFIAISVVILIFFICYNCRGMRSASNSMKKNV
jgi:hypothetical protein